MPKLFSRFKYFDTPLQISLVLLLAAGLSALYSISLASDAVNMFWKQAIFLGFGIAAYLAFSFFDYHNLAKANRIVYVLMVGVLLYVLIMGTIVRGGRRWISFGLFNFQPAEFAKLVVILGLARLLYLRRGQINSWANIGWSFLYAAIPAGLVILEPDMGSALIILSIWAGTILVSPIKKKFLIILLVIAVSLGGVTWKFFLKPFQRDRIMVFIDPSLDTKGKGYNVKQAAIAVGGGMLLGRGLGNGVQSENKFLPESQTDFIFAATSEEIGFVGCGALLLLFLFFFMRLLKIARSARDDLGMYIASGVFFLFAFHVIINVGMNIGIMPVTGIPLPFFSSGGSALVIGLASLGIVQNVAMQSKVLRF